MAPKCGSTRRELEEIEQNSHAGGNLDDDAPCMGVLLDFLELTPSASTFGSHNELEIFGPQVRKAL